jgi:NCS1 family nucleobase:cation symporter-1
MGPIAGILVSDYYLVRNMKLDIRDMYNPHGKYRYYHGWNWRAWLIFFIAVGPILPGFAQSINPNLVISAGALHLYTFSWMWGFVVCVTGYWVICKFISPPTASFSEVAVFPPRTVEEEEEMVRKNRILFGLDPEPESPDSGSIEKIGERFDTKLADEKV